MYADLGATIANPFSYFGLRTPIPFGTRTSTVRPAVRPAVPTTTAVQRTFGAKLPVPVYRAPIRKTTTAVVVSSKPLVSSVAMPTGSNVNASVSSTGGGGFSFQSGSGGDSTSDSEDSAPSAASAFDFKKSPLPLILAGVAALFLLNRKGR